jgi:hypothetical protein
MDWPGIVSLTDLIDFNSMFELYFFRIWFDITDGNPMCFTSFEERLFVSLANSAICFAFCNSEEKSRLWRV